MPRLTRLGVLAAFFCACGETLPGVDTPSDDAGVDGGGVGSEASTDAGTDVLENEGSTDAGDASADGPCSVDLPFGTPQLLTEIAPLGDVTSVRLDRDGGGLAIVSADSGPPSFLDILEVNFPMGSSELPTKLVSTNDDESTPAPVSGGMKVYYDRPFGDAGGRQIVSASRTQPGQTLGGITVEDLPSIPLATTAMQPWSVAGTDVLYYVAAPGNGGTKDIYRAEKNGSTWEPTAQRTAPFDETHPVVTDDEMVIYYARNDTGTRKIWVAARTAPGKPFTGDIPVDAANEATANDEPSWISPDQCALIFTSDRSGAPRAYRIVRQR